MKEFEQCPICGKVVESHFMENHHYIPESKGGSNLETFRLCGTCHDILHYYIPIDEIENYKTPYELLENPFISIYVSWISNTNHTGHWNIKKTLMAMTS
jgi:hypothetical protein